MINFVSVFVLISVYTVIIIFTIYTYYNYICKFTNTTIYNLSIFDYDIMLHNFNILLSNIIHIKYGCKNLLQCYGIC